MLISFKFSNILSFNEKSELDLKAEKYTKHENHVIRSFGGYKLLRMAAIYGANAAGKSNIILALEQLRKTVVFGTVDKMETLPIEPFKFSDPKIPTKFDIEYSINNKVYKYILEINDSIIINEILYKLDVKKNKFIEVFTRKSNKETTEELKLYENIDDKAKDKLRAEIYREDLRPNQPFLKEGSNKSLQDVSEAHNWFVSKLIIIGAFARPKSICSFISKEYESEEFKNFFEILETGISKINILKKPLEEYMGFLNDDAKNDIIRRINKYGTFTVPNKDRAVEVIVENGKLYGQELQTEHIGKDEQKANFSLNEESTGVQRLFEIMPALYGIIEKNEITIIIDELERSIHPILLINILEYFNKLTIGQLIFTTHESTLLDLDYFRQDEIWFVEKDKYSESHVYSLAEYKPRFDKKIRKSYFEGRFGAIPILGNTKFLEE